jgi:ABC-type uncharacterized transport system ATPase component
MSILKIKNLNLKINNINILNNINCEFQQGEFIQIFGANGSGKSSLLKCLYKQYANYNGEIILNNTNIKEISNKKLYKKIAFITQDIEQMLFQDLSIKDNYMLFSQKNHYKEFIKQLKLLNNKFKILNNIGDIIVKNLSGGQKQLLVLYLMLERNPELIILDEHISAIDKKMVKIIMDHIYKIINQKQITCIMVCHDLEIVAKYNSKIIILKNGKIENIIQSNNIKAITKELVDLL